MPPKLYRDSFAFPVEPGFICPSAFVIQSFPVLRRRSGFTIANNPQNVKNSLTSIPEAAAVVDRISVGHTRSRCPSQATIVILFFRLNPSTASRSASAWAIRSPVTPAAPPAAAACGAPSRQSRAHLPDHVALGARGLARAQEVVARELGPGRDVGPRARVGS